MTAKRKKMKLDGEQIKLAQRYEMAWHNLFYKKARFAQAAIIEEPHGRHASELAKEVRRLAESDVDIEVSGKMY